MQDFYHVEFCSLHVRASNTAARHLYLDTLGYKQHNVEKAYYADDEDGIECRLRLCPEEDGLAA
jgi:peptide alpha-N-acetyltransferase